MNKLYNDLVKIGIFIMVILAMHFYPNYSTDIIIAFGAAITIELIYRYSEISPRLKWLQIAKENARKYNLKRKLNKIYEAQQFEKAQKCEEEYRKILIKNALEKTKSSDESERRVGLEQLSQLGDEYVYERLLEILKNNRLNRLQEKQIIETVCKIIKNINKN